MFDRMVRVLDPSEDRRSSRSHSVDLSLNKEVDSDRRSDIFTAFHRVATVQRAFETFLSRMESKDRHGSTSRCATIRVYLQRRITVPVNNPSPLLPEFIELGQSEGREEARERRTIFFSFLFLFSFALFFPLLSRTRSRVRRMYPYL